MRRPTLLRGYRAILEKEVIEAWRTWRLGTVAGLFVVLGIVTPVAVRYLPELLRAFAPPEAELGLGETSLPDVVDQLVGNLVTFGAVAGVLLAMGSVAREREARTAGFVLARPVTRAAWLWAKLVAIAMILAVGVGLAVVAAWLYSTLLFRRPSITAWAQLTGLVWLSAMTYASITLLGSVLFRGMLGAAAIGLGAFAALSLAASVPSLAPWLPSGLGEAARAVGLKEATLDLDPARTAIVAGFVIAGAFLLAWLRIRRADL